MWLSPPHPLASCRPSLCGPEKVVVYDQHAYQGRAAALQQHVHLFVWREVESIGRIGWCLNSPFNFSCTLLKLSRLCACASAMWTIRNPRPLLNTLAAAFGNMFSPSVTNTHGSTPAIRGRQETGAGTCARSWCQIHPRIR